jgi:phage baseplate assembly protein W
MTDNRSFLGAGVRFPVAVGPHGGLLLSAGELSIAESIWLILSTAPGERVMNAEFGCGIQNLVFAPNTSATSAEVAHHVEEALLRFEPRIEVLDVRVTDSGDLGNLLLVAIDYRVRDNNTINNVVYPFYITEGLS